MFVVPSPLRPHMELARHTAIATRERLWRGILETLPVAVGLIDLDGNFYELNAMARELFATLISRTSRLKREAAIQRVLRTGRPSPPTEFTVPWPDGETRVLVGEIRAVRDDDGAITGAVAIVNDITERKRAESRLHDS